MDDEVFRQITRVNEYFSNADNYYQLVRYASYKSTTYRWFSSSSKSMPGANLPTDIVHQLIKQVLEEDPLSPTRRKIPEDVDIGTALHMGILSKLSALAESRENRLSQRESDLIKDSDESSTSPLETAASSLWSKANEDDDDERRTIAAQRIDRFLPFIAGDHLVHAMIILARDEGLYKPVEILARRLDVTINDIYVARKRLKSAVNRFLKSEKI